MGDRGVVKIENAYYRELVERRGIMATYTYVILEVSKPTFNEIADKLKDSYAEQFHYDKNRRTIVIVMSGLALALQVEGGEVEGGKEKLGD